MKKQEILNLVKDKLSDFGAINLPIVVAVSGGVDSMVLLDAIRRVMFEKNITVVHVNHNLRKNSAKDAKLVEQYCENFGLDFKLVELSIPKPKSKKVTLEEKARELRYKALRQEAQKAGAVYIVLAHHANDQVETALFNMVRGSSLRGMGGMKEWAGDLLRPLLGVWKTDLEKYAKTYKIKYAVDETNKNIDITRNFIRNKVIVDFEKINPKFLEQMLKTTSVIQSAEQAVRDMARLHVAAMAVASPAKLEFPISKISELTPFMRAEVVKYAAELLGVLDVEWSARLFEQIDKMVFGKAATSNKSIGSRLLVAKAYDKISISLK
ncbi:MAG: tRNA lysidine(34) synthetase TilS [Patescibacteria group bacterium]